MNTYRFILEKYRGISTRYIYTENNNNYLSERVGKCEYYHTPREYFTDNPWKREDRDVCSFVQKHRYFEQMNMNKPAPSRPAQMKLKSEN